MKTDDVKGPVVEIGPDGAAGNGATGFLTQATSFRAVDLVHLFEQPPPASASARRYLRQGLPEMYQEQDFAMRMLEGLEQTLDPLVAIIDSLPAYFDVELAPQDVLELLTAWLGVELDETQSGEQWRRVLRQALELGRWRGTRRGVTLTLQLAFPDLEFRVDDKGGVISAAPGEEPPEEAPEGGFVVYCNTPISEDRMPTIARVIETARPVNVPYRLRVRKPKQGGKGRGEAKSEKASGGDGAKTKAVPKAESKPTKKVPDAKTQAPGKQGDGKGGDGKGKGKGKGGGQS